MQINAERDVEDVFQEVVSIIDCMLHKKANAAKVCQWSSHIDPSTPSTKKL